MKECSRCQRTLDESLFYFYVNVSTSICKECTSVARREYYRKNNVLLKEKRRSYVSNNKEKVSLLDKKYKTSIKGKQSRLNNYNKNIEKNREIDRNRYRKYWIKRRLAQIKSKSKANGVAFDISEQWAMDQLQKQDWKCYWTGVTLDINSVLFKPSFDLYPIHSISFLILQVYS